MNDDTSSRFSLDELLTRALRPDAGRMFFSIPEMSYLLQLTDAEALRRLYAAAYQVKLRTVGATVYLRGLIEIGNYCTKNCFYCGIRSGNTHLKRYQLSQAEILRAAQEAYDFRYGSVVLQGGERSDAEFVNFITDTVREIKKIGNGALGITLSLGEQSEAVYRQWVEAGAHRYLLRIESSRETLYHTIHPRDERHSFSARKQALADLRTAGFQVGTGVMSGLPGQTADDLAHDIAFFGELDVDMIGMGPYIPHHDTPLGQSCLASGMCCNAAQQLEIGLKMIAVTRLALQNVNIASTTALQALDPSGGREKGLLAGGNIIMPNVSELAHRKDYLLYDGKPGTDENAATSRNALERAIGGIGETIGYDRWGDSPHAQNRGAESCEKK